MFKKHDCLYKGIENPIYITKEADTICNLNIKPSKYIEIRQSENGCYYYIKPLNMSENYPIFIEINNQKINLCDKLKLTPDPVINIRIDNNSLKLSDIKSKTFIQFIQPYFNYDTRYSVKSLLITIIRNNRQVYAKIINSGRLPSDFLNEIQTGDKIDFSSIKLNAPEGERRIKYITFEVSN